MSDHDRTPSRTDLQSAIDRVSGDKEACELVYTSHPTFPYPPTTEQQPSKPHLVILDSSFNPPHYAHLSMAASILPPPTPSTSPPSSNAASSTLRPEPIPYNARLLLFSVRNIEKVPKAGDASMVQRLEMTILLARRLATHHALPGGTGVGILNEPTFVGKSRILHSFFAHKAGSASGRIPKFSFLIGTDTLTRFFEPKFYKDTGGMDKASREYFGDGGSEGEGSLLICGRRGAGEENRRTEVEVLDREEVRPWVQQGCVRMLGTGSEGWEEVSSTRIRKAVQDADEETLGKLLPKEIADYIAKEGLYTA